MPSSRGWPSLPGQLEKVARAFWIPPPGPTELVRTAIVFHFHLPLPDLMLGLAGFLSLLLVAITGLELRRRWARQEAERASLLVLITLAVAPIVLMFAVSQVRPVYVERGVMVSAAVYYLLLATALRWMPVRPLAWGLWAALGVGIVAAHAYQYSYEEFPRSPFHVAARYLTQQVQREDVVLHDNKLSYFPTYFFARDLAQGYLADAPDSPNGTLSPRTSEVLGLHPTSHGEAVRGHRRLWLVVFQGALDEAAAADVPLPGKRWLDERYRGELQASIGDLRIYLYRLGT